jgi:hypothetical protein
MVLAMQTETDPVTLTARDRAYVFRRFCHPRIAVSLGFHLLERIGTSIPRAPHLATRILTTAGGSRPDSSAHAGILRTARPAHRCTGEGPCTAPQDGSRGKRSCRSGALVTAHGCHIAEVEIEPRNRQRRDRVLPRPAGDAGAGLAAIEPQANEN